MLILIQETFESFKSALVLMKSSQGFPLLRVQQDVRPLLSHELDGPFRGPAVPVHQVAADQGGAASPAGLAVDVDGGLRVVGDHLVDKIDTPKKKQFIK